ncbi:MAG: hypothetical protein ACREC1_06815 [Methylovirgula sp.]
MTVFVTGASAGFGAAIAWRFAKEGHLAVATGRQRMRSLHSGERPNFHDFDRRLRNLQVRMAFEKPCSRFVRLRFDEGVEMDVIFDIGRAARGNTLRLAASLRIADHLRVVAHPFVPLAAHLLFRRFPFIGVGLRPIFEYRRGYEI